MPTTSPRNAPESAASDLRGSSTSTTIKATETAIAASMNVNCIRTSFSSANAVYAIDATSTTNKPRNTHISMNDPYDPRFE